MYFEIVAQIECFFTIFASARFLFCQLFQCFFIKIIIFHISCMFSNKIVDQIPCFFHMQIIHGLLLIQENQWSHFMHYFVFLHYRFFPHFLHWFGFEQLNFVFVPFFKEIVSHISCINMVFSIEYSFVPFSKQISSHISCIDMVSLYHGFFLQRNCLNHLLICIWVSSMRSLASAKFIEPFFFKIL